MKTPHGERKAPLIHYWSGCASVLLACFTASSPDKYKTFVVFHASGYDVYDPQHCLVRRHVPAQFDLSARRSTRLQLTSGHVTSLCGGVGVGVGGCEWGDAVVVGNQFVYVSQPSQRRVIVIDVDEAHRPVEVSKTIGTIEIKGTGVSLGRRSL